MRKSHLSGILHFTAGAAGMFVLIHSTGCLFSQKSRNLSSTAKDIADSKTDSGLSARDVRPVPDTANSSTKCKAQIGVDRVFPDKSKLWIQIGTHKDPLTPPDDVGMVGFEPDMNNLIELFSEKKANLYVVSAAVSDYNGIAVFGSGTNRAYSSSLNDLNSNRPELGTENWKGSTKHVVVPVVSLADIIPCLTAGRFKEIEFLICDAQGSDLTIMKGAGEALKLVKKVQLEVAVGPASVRGYYQGVDNSLDSVVAFFASMGFHEGSRQCQGADWSICEEANMVFCRDGPNC
jgi:FkbM family methyltransferase